MMLSAPNSINNDHSLLKLKKVESNNPKDKEIDSKEEDLDFLKTVNRRVSR